VKELRNEKGFFEGHKGRKLFYQYWIPDSGEFKANIIALHGLGTHSHRIETPAEFFTEKGYAFFSFDLRGHWMNIKEVPGHIENIEDIENDIRLFKAYIIKETGEKPFFLMGHSLGGLATLLYAINHSDILGVLASSPLLGFSSDISLEKKVGSFLAKMNPTRVIEFEIDQNKLTTDLKLLRKQIADKHKLTQITYSTYSEIDSAMKWVMKNASNLNCPIFIMQAGNDKITDKNQVKKFFQKINSKDKSYREYDGFLHDLWHEKGRAQVFRDMFVWLEKHI